jgi:hypothetical protein
MIPCGWCGRATPPEHCASCGRDPAVPYVQRGTEPPVIATHEVRPGVTPAEAARRLAGARETLQHAGRPVTVEALAEALDVSPRTVRRWREMAR